MFIVCVCVCVCVVSKGTRIGQDKAESKHALLECKLDADIDLLLAEHIDVRFFASNFLKTTNERCVIAAYGIINNK